MYESINIFIFQNIDIEHKCGEYNFVNLRNEGDAIFMNLGTNFAKKNRFIFKAISYTRHFRL